jgi:hypothetical protein
MLLDSDASVIATTRTEVESALLNAPENSVVPVLFSGFELSASCFAALLGELLYKMMSGDFADRYLVGIDEDGRNLWDADAGLAKESSRLGAKLVCVWRMATGLQLIGEVDPQVRQTYEFVADAGSLGATARDLADHDAGHELSIQAASNRLAKAHRLRVIHKVKRQPVSGTGGTEYVFLAVR